MSLQAARPSSSDVPAALHALGLDALPTLSVSHLLPTSHPVHRVLQLERSLERLDLLAQNGRIVAADGGKCPVDLRVSAVRQVLLGSRSHYLSQLDTLQTSQDPLHDVKTFKDLLHRHGLEVAPAFRDQFHDALASMSRDASRRSWSARIQIEAIEAAMRGWFVVFDTVTYDPKSHDDEVMYGRYWAQYKESVVSAVARRLFGSVRAWKRSCVDSSEFCRYFAVPELHKSGRTHLHILWFVKHLPDTCPLSDPNRFQDVPTRVQVSGWPPFPFGLISMRIAVRYDADAFTRCLAWSMPVDRVTHQPRPPGSVVAMAKYVSKYLDKPRPEVLKCKRIRTSRAFGLQTLRQALKNLSIDQLLMLLRRPRYQQIQRYIHGIRLPLGLIKVQVLRQILNLMNSSLLNLPRRNMLHWLKSATGTHSPPKLRRHLSLSMMRARIFRLRNFLDIVMKRLTNTDISELESFLTSSAVPIFVGHGSNVATQYGAIK